MSDDNDLVHDVRRVKPSAAIEPSIVDGVRRVAVMLGPYRNLSTLTASVLALHPECQILNHAGERILRRRRFDFIASPEERTWRDFVAMALRASTGGRRGWYGGSILNAHAFASPELQHAYRSRFGANPLKANPRCLVWKESMKVQQRLMDNPAAFQAIITNHPQVVFIAPMRNPLDVVVSSMDPRHAALVWDTPSPTFAQSVELVMGAFAWVLERREHHPDRVFAFRQSDIGGDFFARLARAIGVTADTRWIEDAKRCFVVHERHHSDEVRQVFQLEAAKALKLWPSLAILFD